MFLSHNLQRLSWYCFHPGHLAAHAGGWQEIKSFLVSILGNHKVHEFILGTDTGYGCTYVTSLSNSDLTFDLAKVTIVFKTLPELYLRNCKV